MRAANLDTYSLSLLTAKEDILNPRSSTNWALFTYDGATYNLKLTDSGAGGLEELVPKFHPGGAMYGLCRVRTSAESIVMICWVGQDVDDYCRTECTSHLPAIKSFFKEAQAFLNASSPEEVTEERITAITTTVPHQPVRRNSQAAEKEETVGTNYRKTNAAVEMMRINRDSFWARAEEERRRAAEDRRRRERERVLQERKEAEERDRKMNEKLQMIEEQRCIQEHEEDMRARFKRSESIEKAAEAAALVSQRAMNPREFFRQLSSQSSLSPTSPSPFRRYQRSLTDTAFIFQRSDSSNPTSPLSPGGVFSFTRTTSPISPNTAPQQATPPTACLPSPPPCRPLPPPSPQPVSLVPTSLSPPLSATHLLSSLEEPINISVQPTLLEEDEEEEDLVRAQMEKTEASLVSLLTSEPEEQTEEDPSTIDPAPKESQGEESDSKQETAAGSADEEASEEEEEEEEDDDDLELKPSLGRDEPPTEILEKPGDAMLYLFTPPFLRGALCLYTHSTWTSSLTGCPKFECHSLFIPWPVNSRGHFASDACPHILTILFQLTSEGQVCVRALYDYQAEDESELSFEPGDIIIDVEAVDKSWWRGFNKDGRQGFFPANYVETI
uniref:Uncharacterized protein n=1 Tax=Denticeps clupeoides TaxID=299321 RepID=A0AAY4C1F8_9TELE